MIGFYRRWFKPEPLVDRKYRLAEELAAMKEEDVREVIRFAKPGWYLANRKKKGVLDEYAKAMIAEVEREESNVE